MNEETKSRLVQLVKDSQYRTSNYEYIDDDEYKNIDQIYLSNIKETVDILYNMALDIELDDVFETHNIMSVIYYLFLEHQYNKDDVSYIKSVYRKMVLEIFENKKYAKFRTLLDELVYAGFTRKELEKLFKKYLKIETDPEVIERYKFKILSIDLYHAFPKQHGFGFTTSILELSDPKKNTVKHIQEMVNGDIRDDGSEIVLKWLRMFYNHKYTKEKSKTVLKQITVNGEYI